jgi:phosphatidylserine/phosphatidylglycerophosphate/cardiolipin synthase-like enzyme
MKRLFFMGVLSLALSASMLQAQIAAWNLTSATTSATSANSNLTASSITVVPNTVAISYQTSPGDIYTTTWSTSSTFSTSGKYWEFSITPNYGYEIVITSMTFKSGRTSTGPQKIQVQYSLDGFATSGITALAETSNPNTSALDQFTITSLPAATSNKITFRIWGYAASGTGNHRLNNVVINGNVNSTTAPGSGIGAASVSPYQWKYNNPTTLTFAIKSNGDTINAARIVRSSQLIWDTSYVTVLPDSIKASFIGDSIQFANINLMGQDSLVVSIGNVMALDTTDIFPITIQTYKGTSVFGRISLLPQVLVCGSPRPMSWVKAKDGSGNALYNNKWIVVQGIVTVANEFGGPTYLQDATAGISAYDSTVSQNVDRGDEIVVLGKVSPYYGMFELNPCSLMSTVSEGNPVDTAVLTIAQIKAQPINGVEPYECRFIRLNNITAVTDTNGNPKTTWAVTGSGTNFKVYAGGDNIQIRISAKTNIANMAIPSGNFDLVGALGQFNASYQILPRSLDDIIIEGGGPRIVSGAPYESNMTASSITFSWTTDLPGSSIVIRGLTSTYTDTLVDTNSVTNHQLVVNGLAPATMYHIKIGSTNAIGTTYTNDYLVSTASQTSKGTMNVYFNHSVNTALAKGENAQNVDISSKLISRINAATYSVDAALYSLSGTVGNSVAAALVTAKNSRGVKIRVIGEADNKTTAPWSTLSSAGITVIFDTYDATNAGAGLMHNKFVIIDNRDTTSDTDDWVWTGSWNATDPGNSNDAQNVIEIQDKALANAYTTEFNEMWGSNTDAPNAATSRFGARKLDNTPHFFIINGTPVESYFSPSDGTTGKIIKTLNKATKSIDVALLSFTRNDIANVMIAKKKAGDAVHALADVNNTSWSVFDTLAVSGVDVRVKGSDVTGFLHHKYAIVDAETNAPDQYVITGSHNWSSSAETANNENTLILKSTRLANLYLQEFSARYTAAGGTDVLTGIEITSTIAPKVFRLLQNYPNPFNPTTSISYDVPQKSNVSLKVFDVLGREVITLVQKEQLAGSYRVQFDASKLSSGIYFYRLQAGSFMNSKKMVLIK